ncbi:MAG: hypothetical protein U9O82_10840 [Thermodesulfobacteriota bacterium]|nr:hypothetical protein [Thermodesulfobacteriota bacterium]
MMGRLVEVTAEKTGIMDFFVSAPESLSARRTALYQSKRSPVK